MLGRLGRAGARWRYAILGVWAAVALAGAVFGGGVYDRTESVEDARGESARAQERLDELAPEGETVVAVIGGADFFTPALDRERHGRDVRAARAARASTRSATPTRPGG